MKLMKYLGKFLQHCLTKYHNEEVDSPGPQVRIDSSFGYGRESSLSMRFMNASGGIVINVNKYDPVKDRHYENLYIVQEGADLAQEISKILLIENLR